MQNLAHLRRYKKLSKLFIRFQYEQRKLCVLKQCRHRNDEDNEPNDGNDQTDDGENLSGLCLWKRLTVVLACGDGGKDQSGNAKRDADIEGAQGTDSKNKGDD